LNDLTVLAATISSTDPADAALLVPMHQMLGDGMHRSKLAISVCVVVVLAHRGLTLRFSEDFPSSPAYGDNGVPVHLPMHPPGPSRIPRLPLLTLINPRLDPALVSMTTRPARDSGDEFSLILILLPFF
jgi:hypothetical protein